MKTFFSLLISGLLSSLLFAGVARAQDSTKIHEGQGRFFVDKNGDGYNDNAPDDDGDGIPNGLDPDWQKKHKQRHRGKPNRFIDLNGDGINDYVQSKSALNRKKQKHFEKSGDASFGGENKRVKHRRRKNH